ncbi:MAG: polysaccharide biosynthesis protein [Clostridiales bacterium]|nr:polysaccharide biosynthesis protein [Clostridiales bacterium]
MKEKRVKIWHSILLVCVDVLAVTLAGAFAYFSTLSTWNIPQPVLLWWGANVALAVLVFLLFNLYRVLFSSVGFPEMSRALVAVAILGVLNVVFALVTKGAYITVGTALVYALSLFCIASAVRLWKRGIIFFRNHIVGGGKKKTRVMIVGGGAAGLALIKEMQDSVKSVYYPVCIADDDFEKRGKSVRGVKIVGTTYEVKRIAVQYGVQEIFVTMPAVEKKKVSEIVQRCQECGCPVKMLPGIYQMANGEVTMSKLRQVDVQDLLGREQVRVNLDEIMGYIENKVVLVTGGGGSIGSELCRQIATHKPKTLIILDIYENNAYEIEQELKRTDSSLNLLTLIASVRDREKMRDVFAKYRPQIVFHAAAHKHVPLMETSPNEAVKNNVFGTLNVAQCADEFAVETFVQISTDKAVNPTNIMGATKRICEMIIQTIGRHSKHTNFVAVRFGNVLGSNGSVIPLFKKQLADGGPLTVTHKDIIRYFMTIPEAVSLVLQAGAYAKGGQIFVLDMGEPVRIYDLAYNLIKLSGLEPNVDVDIVCTGLRPGEKLYEERLMEEEGLQKTENGLISIARPIELDEEFLWKQIDILHKKAYGEEDGVKKAVKELVPTYTVDKRDSVAEALHTATQTDENAERVG